MAMKNSKYKTEVWWDFGEISVLFILNLQAVCSSVLILTEGGNGNTG